MEEHGLINVLMMAEPINNIPSWRGAFVKNSYFTPLLISHTADKFLIFFIMKADLIPLLNVQMEHLVAIECSSEALRVDAS